VNEVLERLHAGIGCVLLRGGLLLRVHRAHRRRPRERRQALSALATKITRRADRFQRRGLAACRAEWRLITATHNLLKLWRRGLSPQPA
jgi:hypothetical protein